jgi:hypothetical protein
MAQSGKGRPMKNALGIGRLGMLAVGLGIVAAVAATPGIASATSDFDISIDGIDVFNGGGSATAESGMGDVAIAFGPNSNAISEGGLGDFASAFSTGSSGAIAIAGSQAADASGNDFDYANAVGNNATAMAGYPFVADGLPSAIPSSFDSASDFGGDGTNGISVALAGLNGSFDSANAFGETGGATAGLSPDADDPANFDTATYFGNLFLDTREIGGAFAGGGPESLGGSNDTAFVDDLFGQVSSTAMAGLGNNFDLAGAVGDNLSADAFGADFLAHILPFF